ncbi:TspO protein [Hanstruepera neustonica]|uniref:TspO protein n=1 Tax=Hanstruepera neustonica TaxID=1445657 RepID=A0A2K1DXT8_9FLAO|nr:TspO/MBR family protein [Hanstruepera neustonica]PNQ72833.1 TspO protein [Hanstruepera neustonica]
MSFAKRLILFLIINFGALALGSWLMDNGPQSSWYEELNKAPWTPAGWVFGVAWTVIMICFSIYLAKLFSELDSRFLRSLFIVQFLLNVSWNFIFFNQHCIGLGLLNITLLTLVIFYFFFKFRMDDMKAFKYLLVPYMLWLLIATSLNAYIFIYN